MIKTKTQIALIHPLALVISVAVAIGVLRAMSIPYYHNYDEAGHSQFIAQLDLRGCLYQQKCDPLRSYLSANVHGGYAYYLTQSLIQATLPEQFDPFSRLFALRLFTVALSVPLILLSYFTTLEIFPKKKLLALFATGIIVLMPSFSDVFAGVNLDAPSALMGSTIIYTLARLLRRGWSWGIASALMAEVVIAYTLKGTILPLFVLIPFCVWLLLPMKYRWVVLGVGAVGCFTLGAILWRSVWFGTASWFYPLPRSSLGLFLPSQTDQDKVIGQYSLETTAWGGKTGVIPEAPLSDPIESLSAVLVVDRIIQNLPETSARQLRGKMITLGVWARTTTGDAAVFRPHCHTNNDLTTSYIRLSSHWQFLTSNYFVPFNAERLQCSLGVPTQGAVAWYDGAVLVEGDFESEKSIVYWDANGLSGTWGGKPFINLLENPSAERTWIQILPSLGLPYTLNQRIVSLLSLRLILPAWSKMLRWSLVGLWATFGGEQPGLSSMQMIPLAVVTLFAIMGVGRIFIEDLLHQKRSFVQKISRREFWLLLMSVISIAFLILYRADIVPFRSVIFDFSSMRHASAGWMSISSLLALGLLCWIPKKQHKTFVASALLVLFVLNMHIQLRVQYPLYNCISTSGVPGGQTCLWILPLN